MSMPVEQHSHQTPPDIGPPSAGRARSLLFPVMAVCSGATVANVYLAQPLLELFTRSLGITASAAGIVVTCAQFGYAAGILFLVPLGDVRRRRPLVTTLLAVTVAALLLAAAAPDLALLAAATALIGGATVIPQVLVPLAAELATPDRRASVVAGMQIGLLTGMIGSRVIGGTVGDLLGWRAAYVLAAFLTAATGALTVMLLPREPRRTKATARHTVQTTAGAAATEPWPGAKAAIGTAVSETARTAEHVPPAYPALLASLPRLLVHEPALRHSCALHALLFGAYTATWTSLVLVLTHAPYGFSSALAALFGALGLAGAIAAPWAGRFIDRRGPVPIIAAALALMLAAAGAYGLGGHLLPAMIVAIVLANIAVQWSQIANQARIFEYLPAARSRANTVYMVSVFLSGAICAALGAACYAAGGWLAVCALQAALTALGCLVLPLAGRYDRRFRSTRSKEQS